MRSLPLIFFVLSACTTPMLRVDPTSVYDTKFGFKFKPPTVGTWYRTPASEGNGYGFAKDVYNSAYKKEGITLLAVANYGRVDVKAFRVEPKTANLNHFKEEKTKQTETGHLEKVKADFKQIKHLGADCWSYDITAKDKQTKSPTGGEMLVYTIGLVCLHPSDINLYIDMSMGQKIPAGSATVDLSKDEESFFKSLTFY